MMTSLDSLFDESLVAAQQPQWPGGKDGEPVKAAVTRLKTLPPLVFAGE
ncbi:MAG: 3-deoxy-7-phosphoheptulonate synthase class II, partial [Actinobacteria bacterium]|nr:3-deoxy-7-phosphoheptulonate synthase class II [Actinomycetota bacterium]